MKSLQEVSPAGSELTDNPRLKARAMETETGRWQRIWDLFHLAVEKR